MKPVLAILTCLLSNSLFGQPNVADRILLEKKGIENQVQSSREDILVYVKIKGQHAPLKVLNENWPENIESTYNILKSNAGQIIYFAEFPTSESGDWNLELKHYFNKDGNTIAFEKIIRFFNQECAEGPITEVLTDLYVTNFKRWATIRSLRDSKENPLTDRNCDNPYKWTIDKKGTAIELLNIKKIRL